MDLSTLDLQLQPLVLGGMKGKNEEQPSITFPVVFEGDNSWVLCLSTFLADSGIEPFLMDLKFFSNSYSFKMLSNKIFKISLKTINP